MADKSKTKFCTNDGSGVVCTAQACIPPEVQVCSAPDTCFCAVPPPPPIVDVFCDPPLVRVCDLTNPQSCRCEAASACTLTISYPANDPNAVVASPVPAYCDGAGLELAVSIILMRMLGGR